VRDWGTAEASKNDLDGERRPIGCQGTRDVRLKRVGRLLSATTIFTAGSQACRLTIGYCGHPAIAKNSGIDKQNGL
jgi:hypothetical protein